MDKRVGFRQAVLLVIWAWMLLFVFVPNLLVVGTSFLTRQDATFVSLPLNLDSYVRLLDPLYFETLLHSLNMAAVTTLLCVLIGYPFSYALSRMKPSVKPLLIVLIMIPFWTNSLVRIYAMKFLLANQGIINQVLVGIGVIDTPLRMLYTEGAVIAGLVYVLLPFMILPLYAVFEQLENSLLEASADLGANAWHSFYKIVIPLTMPGIIAGCLLVLLPALGMFYVADVLGGAKNLLLGNVVKNQFLDARDWPFGAAISVVLSLMMCLMLAAYYLSERRKGKTNGPIALD